MNRAWAEDIKGVGMRTALFLNGVFEDILKAQIAHGGVNYLQPYKGEIIRMLNKNKPSPDNPILLYISTTSDLNTIAYMGEIVGWEDKRILSDVKKAVVKTNLQECYPEFASGEIKLLEDKNAVNLLAIRNMQKCENRFSTSILTKISDKKHLKPRTRAGGWSEVEDIGCFCAVPIQQVEDLDAALQKSVEDAWKLSAAERAKRLAAAPKLPERVHLMSFGFKRNADVIVAVLMRASGVCERCQKPAPFKRKSNGNPFLEVHHTKPLSEGGEDTVENTEALCPNCHRQAHLG